MKERIENWLSRVDKVTSHVKMEFGNLSPEKLNFKPNPKTWSIAQNLDHLIVINKSYYPIIESIRQKKYTLPLTGRLGFLVKLFGNTILKSVQPDRKSKMKTFKIWEPTQSDLPGNIIEQFSVHQEELKKLIAGSEDLMDAGTIISSPAKRSITYKLEMAFEIIVTHEERHLNQAREVMGQ